MSVHIKYKGKTIETLTGGKFIDLHTKGKKMEEDIRVEVAETGGGVGEFNIAYGDTAPTDTTKLWVKTAEPTAVQVSPNVVGSGSLEKNIAAFNSALGGVAAAAVGKKIYAFGGKDTYGNGNSDEEGYSKSIYMLDTETNTLTILSTSLPAAFGDMAAAAVGTKIFLFGGRQYASRYSSSYLSKIYEYDTENNTITVVGELPHSASNIAAVAIGNRIYLFGGVYYTTAGSNHLNSSYVFNTENYTLSTNTTMPRNNSSMAAAAVGTKIYLFGGEKATDSSTVCSNEIYMFNTETGVYKKLEETMMTYAATAAAVGTNIYVFGGWYTNRIRVFDTETNTCKYLSTTLPAQCNNVASVAVGNNIYLFGGHVSGGAVDTINRFAVLALLAENNLLIMTHITDNLFNLLPSVEIGVKNVYKGNADGVGEPVAAALYKDGAWTEI